MALVMFGGQKSLYVQFRKTSESAGPGEPAALGLEGPLMSSHVATGDTAITSLGIILG